MPRNLTLVLIGALIMSVVATTAPAPAAANDTGAIIAGMIIGGIIGAALNDNDRDCHRSYGYGGSYRYYSPPRGGYYYGPPPGRYYKQDYRDRQDWDRYDSHGPRHDKGPRYSDSHRYGPYRR